MMVGAEPLVRCRRKHHSVVWRNPRRKELLLESADEAFASFLGSYVFGGENLSADELHWAAMQKDPAKAGEHEAQLRHHASQPDIEEHSAVQFGVGLLEGAHTRKCHTCASVE